jgi:hypothetical protein
MKHTAPLAIGVLLIATAITGCAAGSPQDSHVASLTSPSAASTTPANSDDKRPRERLDMTAAEEAALNEPYESCMAKNGLGSKDAAAKQQSDSKTKSSPAEARAAEAECDKLLPLPPWEMDRNNPDARDFMQRVVDCLHSKGVKYADVVDDPTSNSLSYSLGGVNNDEKSITLGMSLGEVCRDKASHK